MGALDTLQDGVTAGIGAVTDFVGEHPVGVAVGAASTVALGAGIVALASSGTKTKAKRKTSKKHRRDRRFKSKQKHEQQYKRRRKYKVYGHKGWIHPKRKHHNKRSKKRSGKIHYTKNHQPYIILRSGKARFIKKKGKRRSK